MVSRKNGKIRKNDNIITNTIEIIASLKYVKDKQIIINITNGEQ